MTEAEERRAERTAGYRTKNKNPTQRCGNHIHWILASIAPNTTSNLPNELVYCAPLGSPLRTHLFPSFYSWLSEVNPKWGVPSDHQPPDPKPRPPPAQNACQGKPAACYGWQATSTIHVDLFMCSERASSRDMGIVVRSQFIQRKLLSFFQHGRFIGVLRSAALLWDSGWSCRAEPMKLKSTENLRRLSFLPNIGGRL